MFLFNVTVIIEDDLANDWLTWMKDSCLPAVMAAGYFESYKLLTIVDSPNDGTTYAVQLIAKHLIDYEKFRDNLQDQFTADMYNRYPNKLVSFSTLMEFID